MTYGWGVVGSSIRGCVAMRAYNKLLIAGAGCGYKEPAGEEYEAGEHVLADLEFGPPEETGFSLSLCMRMCVHARARVYLNS